MFIVVKSYNYCTSVISFCIIVGCAVLPNANCEKAVLESIFERLHASQFKQSLKTWKKSLYIHVYDCTCATPPSLNSPTYTHNVAYYVCSCNTYTYIVLLRTIIVILPSASSMKRELFQGFVYVLNIMKKVHTFEP